MKGLHYKLTLQHYYIRVYIGWDKKYEPLQGFYLKHVPSDRYVEETLLLTTSKKELREAIQTQQLIAEL